MLFPRSTLSRWIVAALPLLALNVSAERVIESSALAVCQSNSSFTASLFNIVFTPNNNTVALNVVGESASTGKVMLKVHAAAYGYNFLTTTIDPCDYSELSSFCPLKAFEITFDAIYNNLSSSFIDDIPGVAYGVPDVDLTVKVNMYSVDNPNISLACVQSRLSNGKTVHQTGVGWATAIVAGIGLLASALISGLGHLNTATHIALYALSLFSYFQAIAIVGLCAVPLPPIVQSWTQDFVWSFGIIRVGFLQTLASWYQAATGGTAATVLSTLGTKSVHVVKRGIGYSGNLNSLSKRAASTSTGEYTVKGIDRVAFNANMESTNLFMTGLIFFCIFIIFTLLGVTIFKYAIKLAIKARWMRDDRFQSFREDYLVTLKGIIFRLVLIGYPQMTILCLWEFTQVDSPAEVALAVIVFFGMTGTLALAVFKVFQIARRSERLHGTPAYLLYTDTTTLNKWGFLYVQFRASAYYYIAFTFAYTLIKGMFVAFGQGNGTVQAIAFVIIEAIALVCASVFRPWMDKKANALGISICVINFANAIFLLILTDIFNGPGLLIGIVSVILFIANAAFALALLIIVLVVCIMSFLRKNPDQKYHQGMADNRSSFIKSSTGLAPSKELDALALAARGGEDGMKGGYMDNLSDDVSDGHSSRNFGTHHNNTSYQEPLQSPINPSMPFIPTSQSRSNSPRFHEGPPGFGSDRAASLISTDSRRSNHAAVRAQNNSSPWQRGAGYDH